MATRKRAERIETPQIVAPPLFTVPPSQGGNAIFWAWRFLYNVLGARKERFELGEDGITVVGLTFPEQYDVEQVISDVYRRGDKVVNPKLSLFPGYYFLNGLDPIPYTGPQEMTADLTKIFHGAEGGDGNRSPQYAKDAIAAYKQLQGFAAPRGRPRKNVTLRIGELNEDALRQLPAEEVENLKGALASLTS
jgi:hypothetical protein